MVKLFKQRSLLIGGVALLVVLLLIVVFVTKFGTAYKGITDLFQPQNTNEEVELPPERAQIQKVRLKRQDSDKCIEVGRDGVVRIYETCSSEEPSEVQRTVDLKNISKLFRLVTETDLQKYQQGNGTVYEVTLTTTSGTQTYYVVIDESGGSSPVEEIVGTIENIEEDLPNPSSSPVPSASGVVQSSSSPQPSVTPGGPSPSGYIPPSPSPASSLNPFVCDYTTENKPKNVSNFICSTDPSPVP